MNDKIMKQADTLLKDTEHYPFMGGVPDELSITRTAFYKYFPLTASKAFGGNTSQRQSNYHE